MFIYKEMIISLRCLYINNGTLSQQKNNSWTVCVYVWVYSWIILWIMNILGDTDQIALTSAIFFDIVETNYIHVKVWKEHRPIIEDRPNKNVSTNLIQWRYPNFRYYFHLKWGMRLPYAIWIDKGRTRRYQYYIHIQWPCRRLILCEQTHTHRIRLYGMENRRNNRFYYIHIGNYITLCLYYAFI